MKVTKVSSVTLIGFITGGLLLFLAASCSLFKPKPCDVEQHVEKEHAIEHPAEHPVEHPVGQAKEHGEGHAKVESFVANPFCLACHSDFEEEKLVVAHEKAGVGCERCHGESERHRSDEANITAPELMYTRSKVIPMCMMCHPRHTIKHVRPHNIIFASTRTTVDGKPATPFKVCTDCHAKKHRMKVRTVRWDKATGEVLKEE